MSDTMELAPYNPGVVSLSSVLFNTVILFDTISTYKTHSKKHQSALLKLSVERIFLINWGKSLGLLREKGKKFKPLDHRLNNLETRNVVLNALSLMATNFENKDGRFGLRRVDEKEVVVTKGGFEWTHAKLRCLCKKTQKRAGVRKRVYWVVDDRARFAGLISEVKGFNESLNRLLTPVAGGYNGGGGGNEVVEVVVSHQNGGAIQNGVTYSVGMNGLLSGNTTSSIQASFETVGQQSNQAYITNQQNNQAYITNNNTPLYIPTIEPPKSQYLLEAPPSHYYLENGSASGYRVHEGGGRIMLLEGNPSDPDLVHIEEARHPSEWPA